MAKNDILAWIRGKVTAEVMIAFVLGLVLGLVVLGWWLWPVQWANSAPADLQKSYKENYIQMVADSYALTGNAEVARARMDTVKSPGEKDADVSAVVARLMTTRIDAGDANAATRLQGLASVLNLPAAVSGPMTATPSPAAPVKPASKGSQWLRIVGIAFFLLLLTAGVTLLLRYVQQRSTGTARRRPAPSARPPLARAPEAERVPGTPPPAERSLGHFETAYNPGDDGYDASYSIESAAGEFLGECGVSALETAGIGQPGRVSAFELWLFDKDDVRTETKILLSESAFADAALQEKLANKGELMRVAEGQVITLETANLRLNATILDAGYTSDSEGGVFARLATRLEVEQK